MNAPELYLDLLTRVLTGTIFESEPDRERQSDVEFLDAFIRHYIRGSAVTMLPLARMRNLRACAVDVLQREVPGDFIETGVWRGGATIFMRGILGAYGISNRKVWVADSFEGLPSPDAAKFPLEAKVHAGPMMSRVYNHFGVSVEDVRRNFETFGLLDGQVAFLKGWFKDTLPTAPIGALALMRLDGDYYESTRDALNALYDRLSIGGYAIIDDYAEDEWTYCRKAVDEFRAHRAITDPMIEVDSKCYYWQRSR